MDLVPQHRLVEANSRFETVTWISTVVGPPVGGALIGLVGPVITIMLDTISYLLSALRIRAIAKPEPAPPAWTAGTSRMAEVVEGWRPIAADPVLRRLFVNTVLVSALIKATAPLLAYLMLHELGFTALQYMLGLGIPCLGGILGARLSRPLTRRLGQRKVPLGFGLARALWLVGLVFVRPGTDGLLVVMVVEAAMIFCMGIFNPVFVTYRPENTATETTARVLTAWTITGRAASAAATALWGVLAAVTDARTAIAVAGILLIGPAVLLPWRRSRGRCRGRVRHAGTEVMFRRLTECSACPLSSSPPARSPSVARAFTASASAP
ncbi:MFS transporter [Nonomuraea sp. NPDC049695]|uniref:MFS transporter n=1 Tax=Nonomuraea sp. NPDC049695 TaxID=3154734 RepID=UPI00342BD691